MQDLKFTTAQDYVNEQTMNKRIQELAFECARQLNWTPPSDPAEYTFSSAGLKKFAELIVRECLQMADEFELDVNRSGLVDRMKEHFGVEA